ncbi:hypothetical protein H0266_18265 [Halobacillus locisalis]|uniref:Uncharacterized protein n=1 Tax=Halobacillus locisalis TaxID=220753 RepID=A0A838CXR5_9BACI|nr:hypothetical protein [Halobacillus locisalis]MBA2176827.1 hypothetical protein [Halobacillus locisalis]
MKLYMLGIDRALEEQLTPHFGEGHIVNSLEEVSSTTDEKKDKKKEQHMPSVLLISDKDVNPEELSNIQSQHEYIFYLVTNSYSKPIEKNIRSLCHLNDITLIPPRLTEEQIAERVFTTINPEAEKENNVVSFLSTASNIGVTTLTLNVAHSFAKHSKAKIGVLLLNAWESGEVLLPNFTGSYLNDIKGKLSNKLLDSDEEFRAIFHSYENMYVLGGNRNTRLERLFNKEEISYLIERAKKEFDIVLIDAGSHFDNALMIQVLEESSHKYIVSNQQPKVMNHWKRVNRTILEPLGYSKEEFMLIINEYNANNSLQNATDITKEFETMLLTTIPWSSYGAVSEADSKFLYDFNDAPFNESIDHIMKAISRENDIPLEEVVKKRKSLFSLAK